jgi:hypothetical protein
VPLQVLEQVLVQEQVLIPLQVQEQVLLQMQA